METDKELRKRIALESVLNKNKGPLGPRRNFGVRYRNVATKGDNGYKDNG